MQYILCDVHFLTTRKNSANCRRRMAHIFSHFLSTFIVWIAWNCNVLYMKGPEYPIVRFRYTDMNNIHEIVSCKWTNFLDICLLTQNNWFTPSLHPIRITNSFFVFTNSHYLYIYTLIFTKQCGKETTYSDLGPYKYVLAYDTRVKYSRIEKLKFY